MHDSAVQHAVSGDVVGRRLSSNAFFALTVVTATAVGLLLRLTMVNDVIGHVDEPASLLAARRVAEVGYPRFPSGLIYLQGATFSYAAAPLSWFFDGTDFLHASRALYMVIALLVIPLSMALVQMVTASPWLGLFVGLLVAFDPNLMFWGVTIRPYGILATAVVAFVLLFVILLRDGPDARAPVGRIVFWIPVIAFLGTFTHIGFLLCYPPLYVIAAIVWKRALLTTHRSILRSGMISLAAPLAFLVLSRLGVGSGTGGGPLGNSIIGGHLFGLLKSSGRPDLRWSLWTDNFTEGVLFAVIPSLIALSSGVVVYALLNRHEFSDQWRAQSATAVVFVHWFIIVAVTLLVVSDFEARYLTQVLPLGYVIVGIAAWLLWHGARQQSVEVNRIARAGIVVVLVFPALLQAGTAANWRMSSPGGSPDYWVATEWASQHYSEGQAVITALPPSTYFWFPNHQDDLLFLAGPEASNRVARYVRTTSDGEQGDYWLGLPSITSAEQLCATLRRHSGNGWVIVDVGRLYSTWAFYPDFKHIIVGASREEFRGPNGVLVYAIRAGDEWSDDAKTRCAG